MDTNGDYRPVLSPDDPGPPPRSFLTRNKISVLSSIVVISIIINMAFFLTFIYFSYFPATNPDCTIHGQDRTGSVCQCSYLPNYHLASLVSGPACPKVPPVIPSLDPSVFTGAAFVDLFNAVEQQILAKKKALNVSAISAALVYDQQVVWSKNWGYADPFKKIPADEHTIYRIASITKVFTNVMLYKLRDEGKVGLDDPVVKYEPRFVLKNPFNTSRPITFRQLASHLSGLPNEAPCVPPESSCTAEEVYTYLNNLTLILPQYFQPSYSNFGFAVLGRVLEKAIGQSYEDYVMDKILAPLGMMDSGFNFTPAVVNHTAIGFYANGSIAPLYDTGYDAPNGQMFSSTADLASFMQLMFRDSVAANDGSQILDGVTLREMLLPAFVYGDGASAWGFPWETVFIDGHWVRTKSGGIDGYSSHLALVDGIKVGMVVLTSKDGIDPSQMTIPNLYPVISTFTAALSMLEKSPPTPPNMDDYLGAYRGNDSSIFNVTKEYGRLYGKFGSGLYVQLTWKGASHNSTFTLQNIGFDRSCISVSFAAVDGTEAIFAFAEGKQKAEWVQFPGFTWRDIIYARVTEK